MAFQFVSSTEYNVRTALTVPYSVRWESGIWEANSEDGPTAVVKFQCLRSNVYTLVQQLLGLWTGTPPNNIIYSGPFAYPPSPNLICTSVDSIEPLGRPLAIASNFLGGNVGLPWITGKRSIVTARFTVPPYQPVTSGAYFSLTFAAGAEFLTIPGTIYQFADSTPIAQNAGIPLPTAEVTVTRFKMPFIPDQIMAQCLGSVNAYPFTIGWNTYAPGTLMFFIGNTSAQADVFGNITYIVEYKFQYRSIPWNYFLYPKNRTTGFAPVFDGNGNMPFPQLDYSVLP
jgi:hypothetical protein